MIHRKLRVTWKLFFNTAFLILLTLSLSFYHSKLIFMLLQGPIRPRNSMNYGEVNLHRFGHRVLCYWWHSSDPLEVFLFSLAPHAFVFSTWLCDS